MIAMAALPIIVATVILDLTGVEYDRQRHAIHRGLFGLAAGEDVRVRVSDLPGCGAAELLAEIVEPLAARVTVEGDCQCIVQEWVHALQRAVHQRVLRSGSTP